MGWQADVREAIRDLVREMLTDQTVQAVVKSVNKEAGTIVATGLEDELEYFNVRLKATAMDETGQGVLAYPVVGSRVLLTIIDGIDAMAFVSRCSEIEEYAVTLANGVGFRVTSGGKLQLNGDGHGGLVMSEAVAAKHNALIDLVEQLMFLPPTGQPSTLLIGGTTVIVPGLTLQQYRIRKEDLENDVVTHG